MVGQARRSAFFLLGGGQLDEQKQLQKVPVYRAKASLSVLSLYISRNLCQQRKMFLAYVLLFLGEKNSGKLALDLPSSCWLGRSHEGVETDP